MYARLARGIANLSLLLGGICMAIMTVITIADVFMRYVFKSPLPGTGEHTQLLLAVIVFAGLVLVTREGTHIVVSLCEGVLNRHIPGLYNFFYLVAHVAGLALILYTLFLATLEMYEYEEETLVMEYPMVYLGIIMTVMVVLAVFQLGSLMKISPSGNSDTD